MLEVQIEKSNETQSCVIKHAHESTGSGWITGKPLESSHIAPYPRNCSWGRKSKRELEAVSRQLAVQLDHCVLLVYINDQAKAATHMVKQSYMKLSPSTPMTLETSSGMGGAWLRLPSL